MADYRDKMNTREAADYLGLAPRTLEKMRLTGGGPPYFKPNRRVIYDRAELDQWLENSRRFSTSTEDVSAYQRAHTKTPR